MDISILQTILSDKSLLVMLMTPGMVVTLIFMLIIYKLINKFTPELTNALHETRKAVIEASEQTKLIRELLSIISQKVDVIENNIIDNTKRLDAIELTLKRLNDDIMEMRIKNSINKDNNNDK